MPRRRKIEIKVSELECYDMLVAELSKRTEFANFDAESLRVWTYESYEQELKGVDKALRHVDTEYPMTKEEILEIINTHTEHKLW